MSQRSCKYRNSIGVAETLTVASRKGFYNKKETAISGRSKVVQLLHIPALIALILSIIGGLDQYSSDTSEHSGGKTETRVGIILFLAIYIVLCILWSTTVKDLPRMAPSQKRIVGVVLIALPLIACRLLYSLVADLAMTVDFHWSMEM